ncbi:hypothetical protein HDU82_001831, partial [Entophlyctis luteolus]
MQQHPPPPRGGSNSNNSNISRRPHDPNVGAVDFFAAEMTKASVAAPQSSVSVPRPIRVPASADPLAYPGSSAITARTASQPKVPAAPSSQRTPNPFAAARSARAVARASAVTSDRDLDAAASLFGVSRTSRASAVSSAANSRVPTPHMTASAAKSADFFEAFAVSSVNSAKSPSAAVSDKVLDAMGLGEILSPSSASSKVSPLNAFPSITGSVPEPLSHGNDFKSGATSAPIDLSSKTGNMALKPKNVSSPPNQAQTLEPVRTHLEKQVRDAKRPKSPIKLAVSPKPHPWVPIEPDLISPPAVVPATEEVELQQSEQPKLSERDSSHGQLNPFGEYSGEESMYHVVNKLHSDCSILQSNVQTSNSKLQAKDGASWEAPVNGENQDAVGATFSDFEDVDTTTRKVGFERNTEVESTKIHDELKTEPVVELDDLVYGAVEQPFAMSENPHSEQIKFEENNQEPQTFHQETAEFVQTDFQQYQLQAPPDFVEDIQDTTPSLAQQNSSYQAPLNLNSDVFIGPQDDFLSLVNQSSSNVEDFNSQVNTSFIDDGFNSNSVNSHNPFDEPFGPVPQTGGQFPSFGNQDYAFREE